MSRASASKATGFVQAASAHDAVRAAQGYFREGKSWVVDLDIKAFFDHVNHDILLGRIGKTIRDKRVLRLIGKYLRRGHCFCRYADDVNIYVGSGAAAQRVLAAIRYWIETHLRLQVNATKSGTGRPWERKFLGFRLTRKGEIEVSPESLERFKAKVRELWRVNQSRTSNQLRDAWKQYVQGW